MELTVVTQSFVEYKDVKVTEPLRQGDVIEAIDVNAVKWRRHLLVITADCDFANAKHQGRVTCVPLLSQDEYLMEFQVPRIRDRVIDRSVAQLQNLLTKHDGPSISSDRLRQWPLEQEPREIVAALGFQGSPATDAERLFASVQIATQLPLDLDGAVTQLVTAQVNIPNGKQASTAQREAIETLRAHYSKPPGDALFLSAVAPSLEAGYFVYLRHLEQVMQPEIAVGPTRSAATYRRLARLEDRFIHAVAQQFALVFMSIGLPRDYEEIRDLHSELLGERYR